MASDKSSRKPDIAPGSYIFVTVVFVLLGLAFLLSTGSVIYEFRNFDWPLMLMAHSHLFIFFPILGLLALTAFYVPSVVFTDLYWRHKTNGRLRFVLGGIVAIALSLYLAHGLAGQDIRGIWELSPETLNRDRSAGPIAGRDCHDETSPGRRQQCPRQPLVTALQDLHDKGQKRTSISPFSRVCAVDALLERPETDRFQRYCFPSGTLLNAADCCRLQREFSGHLLAQWSNPAQRSKAADLDRYLMPFKVFFIVVLVVIGCFMILWRRELRTYYGSNIPAIERGIAVGALAMLFWPLMDYGYQQTSDVLFGRHIPGLNARLSLVIAPWAVLLLLYFMDLGKNTERVAQISTLGGALFAALRYQEINDLSARMLGSGAAWWNFLFLAIFAAVGVALLRGDLAKWFKGHDEPPPGGPDGRPQT